MKHHGYKKEYTFTIEYTVDLDGMNQLFQKDKKLNNCLINTLGEIEASLIKQIVADGVETLKAQYEEIEPELPNEDEETEIPDENEETGTPGEEELEESTDEEPEEEPDSPEEPENPVEEEIEVEEDLPELDAEE